jgi:outer membrane protein OmpA-like peptidoglycan-associated protein
MKAIVPRANQTAQQQRRPPGRTASFEAAPLPATSIARLQRAVGNRTVARLFAPRVDAAARPRTASTLAVQRKCSGCEKEAQTIQPKLAVGPADDEYEREADRVAEHVMRMPDPVSRTLQRTPAIVQRVCKECEEEDKRLQGKAVGGEGLHVSPAIESQIASLKGAGHPLPASARSYFEPRFGQDFGRVRVHTGPRAAEAAHSIGALAFTAGRDVAFAAGRYAPETSAGRRLLAHELTHVVQQGAAIRARAADIVQRVGDPSQIPAGLPCPTDLTAGRPAGTDIKFGLNGAAITPAHTTQLTAFVATWTAAGGTDDVLVHGYASTVGDQASNWTLSCNRAEAVRNELVRLGIPRARTAVVAHGESTDFGSAANNQHAVVTSGPARLISLPICAGTLTARDNFTGRSAVQFGVGETIDLNFLCFPATPAADLGGLEWHIASGGGALAGVTDVGTGTYTAPAAAGAVTLELRVARGATAGRVVSTHTITIVIPASVRMVAVPGSFPTFAGTIAAGTWGAGFQASVFVDPRNVSFQGVVFGEGTVAAAVTGTFLAARAGLVHPVNTFGPGHPGNATTGTPVSPPNDNIATAGGVTPTAFGGVSICGVSDFLWAIPWEFSVAGGPRTRFAGGFTANHHVTSTAFCNATIEKGGAGPFCRRINGTTC